MNPFFDWISILLLVGAGHGLLLALTLLNLRRGNRVANRVMAAILLVFATNMTLHTLAYTKHIVYFPHFFKIEPPLMFLFAPLFYFYVRVMTGNESKLTRHELLHFVPFVLGIVLLTPHYLQPAEEKIQHFLADHERLCWQCLFIYWMTIIQLLGYILAIARLLKRHRERIKLSYSSLEKINLSWLRNLLALVVLIWLVAVILQIIDPTIASFNYMWLIISVSIYLVGYIGLGQPEIFYGVATTPTDSRNPLKKYEKSTLTPDKAATSLQKLNDFMEKERPYLRSDLTLPLLARELTISVHHLSQIINEKLGQNFFEFINCQRVEEAKRRIAEPGSQNLNLAGIGLEVGFNSISSFNAAFKRHAGMTPSQFRDKYQPPSPPFASL